MLNTDYIIRKIRKYHRINNLDCFIQALLASSGVDNEEKLRNLISKFDRINQNYLNYINSELGQREIIEKVHNFLWKDSEQDENALYKSENGRYIKGQRLLSVAIDSQLMDSSVAVGNCVSLTGLFSIMLIKNGIHLDKISFLYFPNIMNSKKTEINSHVSTCIKIDDKWIYVDSSLKKGIDHIENSEYVIKGIKYFINEQLSSFIHVIMNTDIESSYKLAYFNLEIEKNSKSILLLTNAYNLFMKKLLMDGVEEDPGFWPLVFELVNYYINENEFELAKELLSKCGENEWQTLISKGIIFLRKGLLVEGFGNYFLGVNQMDRTDPKFKEFYKGIYYIYNDINKSKYIKDKIKEDIRYDLTAFSEQYQHYSTDANEFLNNSNDKK